MDEEEENFIDSDSSDNEAKHSTLVNFISQLDNTQRVKPASRKELSSEVSEYNLSKSKKNLVNVKELAQVLKSKPQHVSISKKLKKVIGKARTLPKPLEKPLEEKLKRTIGFEKVKKQVHRWDAVVARNALKDHMVFPLKDNSMKMQPSSDFFKQFQSSTELESEISKLLKQEKKPSIEEEEINNFPLTLKEMVEKRKEMAQLRAKLSYREAKAQRQSKIKSKKFHRILKREKLKQQLKDFEILQKTDPEAALKKLSELDKTRAKERASLRHRNTGQWAKNMTVRAKYDVESRKVLADQLKMSRELTQKVRVFETSDEEELNEQNDVSENKMSKGPIVAKDNPWSLQVSEEMKDFITSHTNFYDKNSNTTDTSENNKENKNESVNLKESEITKETSDKANIKTKSSFTNGIEKNIINMTSLPKQKNDKTIEETNKSSILKRPSKQKVKSPKSVTKNNNLNEKNKELVLDNKVLSVRPTAGLWIVTPILKETEETPKLVKKKRKAEDLNTLFNDLEEQLMEKAVKKINKINKNLKTSEKKRKKREKEKKSEKENGDENDFDLSLKSFKGIERPDLDVELLEGIDRDTQILNSAFDTITPTSEPSEKPPIEIDPKNFIRIKPKKLGTYVAENITGGEDAIDNDEKQQQAIEEAFCDDDVTAKFEEEKREENKKKEIEISNSLPGWGEWGGVGLKPNPKKKKRFRIAKAPPRKDKAKVDIIINENENPKIRQHMVKEVPHPFKSVDSFEANIRAPIGREWVPESAHRKIIQKEIETKLGTVIEPMSEDDIVRVTKTPKCPYQGKKTKSNN